MRQKLILAFAVAAAALLAWNFYKIFMIEPDEANQGAIYRIIYIHVPSAFTCATGFFVSLLASVAFLVRKDLKYDAIAASVTEVAWVFATIVLVTGSIWGRIIWGIWWAWDPRLTSMLICWLLLVSYLLLRRAVEEPNQRARLSAVLAIFTFTDWIIVWKSIEWWRTQHPGPVLSIRSGGGMAPGMEAPIYWNWLALAMLATTLVMLRWRQEGVKREIDALRRYAHAL
ncbi:MAG TPA: cytochrome c biogenesis protein CcsA [Bryobacteraceae bacterium]|nr:cytochrome c biogenesis protein CcsA [Bryobacteraceae bacterium]